jgi:FkbM family methyltransferase
MNITGKRVVCILIDAKFSAFRRENANEYYVGRHPLQNFSYDLLDLPDIRSTEDLAIMVTRLVKNGLNWLGLDEPVRNVYLRVFRPDYYRRQVKQLRTFYRTFVPKGSLVFDIGANAGEYTRCFLWLGARVVAAEPNPLLAGALARIRHPRLTVLPGAVGEKPARMTLHINTQSELSTLSPEWLDIARKSERLSGNQWTSQAEVDVTTLEAMIRNYGVPHFIKIDVEGFETCVLDGLPAMPRYLSFEFNSEWPDATIACLEKPCFPAGARFNYIAGDRELNFTLPQWVTASQMISLVRVELIKLAFGDIFVRND